MPENLSLSDPKAIAETGEKIYREKYLAEFEEKYRGQFVAMDVLSGEAYRGDFPEEAVENGRKAAPHGLFHLIRVGSPAAFRVSYSSNAIRDWFFR